MTQSHTHTHTHTRTHNHTDKHIHTQTHIHTHKQTHTHIYTYTQTYFRDFDHLLDTKTLILCHNHTHTTLTHNKLISGTKMKVLMAKNFIENHQTFHSLINPSIF